VKEVDPLSRLTIAIEVDRQEIYVVEDEKIKHDLRGYSGEAVDKLAKFENFYEDLLAKQETYIRELDQLRSEDKTRTVKFRQTFANKLINQDLLILLKKYGL
jgi:hypothetical protein